MFHTTSTPRLRPPLLLPGAPPTYFHCEYGRTAVSRGAEESKQVTLTNTFFTSLNYFFNAMKINKFLTAALAATTLLASCSKEAGNTNSTNGEDRTVQIQIDYAGSETRATGNQIADNTAVAFSGGYLLFTNTGDAVTFVVAIETGSTAYTEAGKKVGITELKAGTQITAVPGNSTKVYFIGNKPSAMAAPAVGDIVSNYTATVASQHSAGTVANVSLFGGKALTPVSAGAADEYEATFDVKPIAARYEIMEITGAHSGGGANTFEYQIDGIFIDKYYDDMKLAGTAGTLKSNGNDPAKYVPNATGSSYVTAKESSHWARGWQPSCLWPSLATTAPKSNRSMVSTSKRCPFKNASPTARRRRYAVQ